MTDPAASPAVLKVPSSSKRALGATTAALVTLASGGTAVLVSHATSGLSGPTALPAGALPQDAATAAAGVVVAPVEADPTVAALTDALTRRPVPGRRTLTATLVSLAQPVPALSAPPVTGPPTAPVTQPVTQPVTPPVTEPVTQPVTAPVDAPASRNGGSTPGTTLRSGGSAKDKPHPAKAAHGKDHTKPHAKPHASKPHGKDHAKPHGKDHAKPHAKPHGTKPGKGEHAPAPGRGKKGKHAR